MNKILRKIVIINSFVVSTLIITKPAFAAIFYELNLRNEDFTLPSTPFINLEVTPEDSNNDTWFETVLRINVGDPAFNNPFDVVEFKIDYDAEPTRTTNLNIGDSRTNNGGSGDGATQSNDAELNIGRLQGDVKELFVYTNDIPVPPENILIEFLDFVPGANSTVNFTIKNEFLAWDNNEGISGSVSSPFLYALNGQPDTEGPVNYDIFAGFNRSIGSRSRTGSGIGKATICLRSSSEASCFGDTPPETVPEPTNILGLFGIIGVASKLKRMQA